MRCVHWQHVTQKRMCCAVYVEKKTHHDFETRMKCVSCICMLDSMTHIWAYSTRANSNIWCVPWELDKTLSSRKGFLLKLILGIPALFLSFFLSFFLRGKPHGGPSSRSVMAAWQALVAVCCRVLPLQSVALLCHDICVITWILCLATRQLQCVTGSFHCSLLRCLVNIRVKYLRYITNIFYSNWTWRCLACVQLDHWTRDCWLPAMLQSWTHMQRPIPDALYCLPHMHCVAKACVCLSPSVCQTAQFGTYETTPALYLVYASLF